MNLIYAKEVESIKNSPHYVDILNICEKIRLAGGKAYLVGGCVRDSLLGREVTDFDFAVSLTPDQVESLFENTNPIGKAFGTIQVVLEKASYELTTFRKDFAYKDGRHPSSVVFGSQEEDAYRRDFTMNAMYMDPISGEIIDFVSGKKDLEKGLLRFIGDSNERIKEDKLRLLRGIRFQAQLGFQMDEATEQAILKWVPEILQVSYERIHVELKKMLSGKYLNLDLLRKSQIFSTIFEGFSSDFSFLFNWKEDLMKKNCFDIKVFYPCFLATAFQEIPQNINDWRVGKGFKESFLFFQKVLKDADKEISKVSALQKFSRLEGSYLQSLLSVNKPDALLLKSLKKSFSVLPHQYELPKRLLSGEDVQKLGIQDGKKIGEMLQISYEIQLNKNISSKEDLVSILKERI